MGHARRPQRLSNCPGVIVLANAFGLRVVAEGVDSELHGDMLVKLGCDMAQGYGIARPMPGAEILGWAAKHRPASRPVWLA